MAKRLWIAVLVAAACVACKSSKKGDSDGSSKMESGNTAVMESRGGAVEDALRALGIDGAIATLDLNQADYPDGVVRLTKLHMLRDFVLAEGGGAQPRVFGIVRGNLNAKWISKLREPTAFDVGENGEVAFFLSRHFFTPLELVDGRRTFRLSGTDVRAPAKPLPFTPLAGPAGQGDTAYIPSLGSSVNNKKVESFSLFSGQRGWGWRALGDVVTRPLIGGPKGDPRLYFVTNTGVATCLDAQAYGYGPKDPRWERRLYSGVAEGHQPFLTDDTQSIVGGYYIVDRKGTVYCVDRITGRFRWTNQTGEVPLGGPMVFGDVCVVPMKSGLLALDKENVIYSVEVVSGPAKGQAATVRSDSPLTVGRDAQLKVNDPKVAPVHVTLRVQGEVLHVSASDGVSMRVDGASIGSRGTVENGSEIAIGGSILRITDVGQRALWKGLKYDRVVCRIADRLVMAKGNSLQVVNAYTGEAMGDAVRIPGARLIPSNPYDATLIVGAGDATVYALYPR